VPPRSPYARVAGVAQPADAPHHAVDVGHLEGDVIQRGVAGAGVGDAVVHVVAAKKGHVPRAVGNTEAELGGGEAFSCVDVGRVEHDMRKADGPVAMCRQR